MFHIKILRVSRRAPDAPPVELKRNLVGFLLLGRLGCGLGGLLGFYPALDGVETRVGVLAAGFFTENHPCGGSHKILSLDGDFFAWHDGLPECLAHLVNFPSGLGGKCQVLGDFWSVGAVWHFNSAGQLDH